MKIPSSITLFIFLSVTLANASPSVAGDGIGDKQPKAYESLDKHALRQKYLDGEFETLKGQLESFIRSPSKSHTREDSIFAFKYLGVLAAADSNTVVLGQSYFTQLLRLSPNIQLVGMYEPVRVKQVFKQVKSDMDGEKDYDLQYDEYGNPRRKEEPVVSAPPMPPMSTAPTPQPISSAAPAGSDTPATPRRKSPKISHASSNTWLWWVLGVGVAGGAGLYVWNQSRQSDPPGNPEIIVDPK